MEKYDITDYLKDDKELQKAVIEEFLKEIAELKAYKDVNEDFKTAWEELKAENDRLKEKFEIESLTDKTTGETIYRSNVVNKLKELLELRIEDLCESCGASSMMPMPCTVYKQTLQEIKYIAETYLTDCQGFKCEAMEEIIQKITKAEEE